MTSTLVQLKIRGEIVMKKSLIVLILASITILSVGCSSEETNAKSETLEIFTGQEIVDNIILSNITEEGLLMANTFRNAGYSYTVKITEGEDFYAFENPDSEGAKITLVKKNKNSIIVKFVD